MKEALTAAETIKAKNKSKPKKITKQDREEEVIVEFEKDGKEILETRINCGLKLDEIHCKKCDFETFSEGQLRLHKRRVHQLKESNSNIILGFKNDITHHCKVLEAMDELNKVPCSLCDFRTNSKGELKIHKQEEHSNKA